MTIAIGEQHSLRETFRNALIITRREVRDSFRDWRIIGPIFVLTLVFPLMAQAATGLFVRFFESSGATGLLPAFLPLLPMIVGFFPISISIVIALETFVGEKERRSIEPLLSTPLTNTELYLGKTLAAMIPPLLASYIGMGIYLGALIFGAQAWRPDLDLIVQIVVLTTAQALVMVTGAVVISGQTTSTRAANLLASFIILPVALLVMLESFIMVTNNRYVLWYIVGGLLIVDAILFTTGARLFNREELLGRQLDTINISWAWRTYRKQFIDGARTPLEWWARAWRAVRLVRGHAVVVILIMAFVFAGGFAVARVRTDLRITGTTMSGNVPTLLLALAARPPGVNAVVEQDVRVVLLATLLSVMSFGVLGVVAPMAPFALLGYILGQQVWGTLDAESYLAIATLHVLLEAPALIIASGAALRLGMTFTQPNKQETVGERFLRALADCGRLFFGVVLPLLTVAGIIEVVILPALFGGH